MNEKDIILYFDKDTIITANVHNDKHFAASFANYRRSKLTKSELEERYTADKLEFSVGPEYVLQLLEEYDCSPKQLAEVMTEYTPLEELISTDIIGEIKILHEGTNSETYEYFELWSVGQFDIRKEVDLDEYFEDPEFQTGVQAIKELLSFWDELHLKTLTKDQEEQLVSIVARLKAIKPDTSVDDLAAELLED